jgi:Domain of unknown function (DUF1707)
VPMANLPGDTGPPGGPPGLRASDADRDRVAEVLRQAAGEGRLTLDELDERLDDAGPREPGRPEHHSHEHRRSESGRSESGRSESGTDEA